MAYKAFTQTEIQPFPITEIQTISISEDSPSANHLHFFTGIRSLGKIDIFKVGTPAAFAITDPKEIKYNWGFDTVVLPGQPALSARLVNGVFISSADQRFTTPSNANSLESNQDIFRFAQSYLYRPDKSLQAGEAPLTALNSSSSANYDTSVVRLVNLRKDLFTSAVAPRSIKVQVNDSNTSLSAAIDGPSANDGYTSTDADVAVFGSQTFHVSSYTTALDLKNPYGGKEGLGRKSFFGVNVSSAPGFPFHARNGQGYTAGNNLDTVNDACTIEAIIRPFSTNSVVYFRRLASTQNTLTKNNFMKLELTVSPDGLAPAFRFSIRSVTADDDFTAAFAKSNVQTSGLFVPNDVGIDLFDGSFHHIAATWDISEIDPIQSRMSGDFRDPTKGAGVVMGYIDSYKLANKEQVFPRQPGADPAGGPVAQGNMLENRIPVKNSALFTIGSASALLAPSGNNVYIGASNYNRLDGDEKGDRGDLVSQYDDKLSGLYDGQIQHIRVWNQRLKDGTTGFADKVGETIGLDSKTTDGQNTILNASGSLLMSYVDFHNSSLTSTSAANIAGWWYFNNINGVTGMDYAGGLSAAQNSTAMLADKLGNISSNTGNVVGNGIVKIFDFKDMSKSASQYTAGLTDLQLSAIPRDFLYMDQPQLNPPVNNYLPQGRLMRTGLDGSLHRVGLTYYDLGSITFDGDDINARLNYTYPASGATGDIGFAVTGHDNTSINFQRVVFGAQDSSGRLFLNATASGNEMNFAGNPTGYSRETEEPIFDDPTSYITSVGLFNHDNDLLAVAKLAKPVKKDETLTLVTQVKLDF